MENLLCEVFYIGVFLRNLAPEEHAHLVRIKLAVQYLHNLLGYVAAAAIIGDVVLTVPLVGIVEHGLGSSELDSAEASVVDVALHLQDPGDKLLVARNHSHTPSRHIVALAERIEFDAAVLGARHLHDAQRMLVEDERIRVVIHHHDVVILGKLHESLVGFHLCHSTGRHVRIVGPHQLHVAEVHLLQRLEVWLPFIVLAQVVIGNLGAENLVDGSIGRIARVWDEHLVARVAEGERNVQDTLLATNEGLDFRSPVKIHVIPSLVITSHRLAQLRDAHCRLISVCSRVMGYLAERIDGLLRRRHVWTSDGEADDVLSLGIKLSHFLQLTAEVVFLYFCYSIGWLYHFYSLLF